MRVFISWGDAFSLRVAVALREWLPLVIQSLKPYVSAEDLRKGNRWGFDIAQELQASQHGIICLTNQTLDSRWVNFEAGALSKSADTASVWTLLLDLEPGQVEGPLSQFQHTRLDPDDFWKLITTINATIQEPLNEPILRTLFDTFWPKLTKSIEEARKAASAAASTPARTNASYLEEILELSRSVAQAVARVEGNVTPLPVATYMSTVSIAPTPEEAPVQRFVQKAAGHPRLKKYGANGGGSRRIPTSDGRVYDQVTLSSRRHLPEVLLGEVVKEFGLAPVSVMTTQVIDGKPLPHPFSVVKLPVPVRPQQPRVAAPDLPQEGTT